MLERVGGVGKKEEEEEEEKKDRPQKHQKYWHLKSG